MFFWGEGKFPEFGTNFKVHTTFSKTQRLQKMWTRKTSAVKVKKSSSCWISASGLCSCFMAKKLSVRETDREEKQEIAEEPEREEGSIFWWISSLGDAMTSPWPGVPLPNALAVQDYFSLSQALDFFRLFILLAMVTTQRCYGYKRAIATKWNSGNVCSCFVFASRRNEGNFSLYLTLSFSFVRKEQSESITLIASSSPLFLRYRQAVPRAYLWFFTLTHTSFNSWWSLGNWGRWRACVKASDGILLLVNSSFVIFFSGTSLMRSSSPEVARNER